MTFETDESVYRGVLPLSYPSSFPPSLSLSLRYNPARDPESRLLLHRAVALQDMAHSILEHELSEDFEQV